MEESKPGLLFFAFPSSKTTMQRLPFVYFGQSPKGGRGVFTSEFIPIGTLIEICPVIVIPEEDLQDVHETCLHDYYFLWSDDGSEGAIALGFGSLYNHSFRPNAEYITNRETQSLDVYAIEDIAAGSEITFNYNGSPHNKEELWFEVK